MHKVYWHKISWKIRVHLNKKFLKAPNNAKSQNTALRIDDSDDRINEEKKSFKFSPAKAFGPFPFIDDPLVIQWYQKEANNKSKEAQYYLGRSYEHGDGVEKDEDKAFKWYKKSAEQGYSNAYNTLGWCYDNCIGTEKDLEKAI